MSKVPTERGYSGLVSENHNPCAVHMIRHSVLSEKMFGGLKANEYPFRQLRRSHKQDKRSGNGQGLQIATRVNAL